MPSGGQCTQCGYICSIFLIGFGIFGIALGIPYTILWLLGFVGPIFLTIGICFSITGISMCIVMKKKQGREFREIQQRGPVVTGLLPGQIPGQYTQQNTPSCQESVPLANLNNRNNDGRPPDYNQAVYGPNSKSFYP